MSELIRSFVLAVFLLVMAAPFCFAEPTIGPEDWRRRVVLEQKEKQEFDLENEIHPIFTLYRSPSTGLEYKHNHWAPHAGWYPVRLRNEGGGLNQIVFFKLGLKHYFNPVDSSPFADLSYAKSLDSARGDAMAVEVGYRFSLRRAIDLRVGLGFLFFSGSAPAWDPTVGLGISF